MPELATFHTRERELHPETGISTTLGDYMGFEGITEQKITTLRRKNPPRDSKKGNTLPTTLGLYPLISTFLPKGVKPVKAGQHRRNINFNQLCEAQGARDGLSDGRRERFNGDSGGFPGIKPSPTVKRVVREGPLGRLNLFFLVKNGQYCSFPLSFNQECAPF